MLRLKLVNEDNFDQVIDLSVSAKDERRVASNVYSLAQAWLYRDQQQLYPYAVEVAGRPVGFLLLVKSPAEREYFIWRLMIGQVYQNRGYGKEVLRQIVAMAQKESWCDQVVVDYVTGNHRMRGMLEKLGFEMDHLQGNEIVMKLNISKEK